MQRVPKARDRTAKWVRWVARGIGSLAGVVWLFTIIASTVLEGSEEVTWEGGILAGLVIVATAGILIAWWQEGIGGTIAVIGGVALGVFASVSAGRNDAQAVLVSGGPFLIAGILFLTSWRRSTRGRISSENP